jgi:hypothetical protein
VNKTVGPEGRREHNNLREILRESYEDFILVPSVYLLSP